MLHLPPGVLRRPNRPQDQRESRGARRTDRREAAQRAHRHREAVLQEGIHAIRQLLAARGAARGEPWLGRTRCSAVPTAGPSSRSGRVAATAAERGTPSWKKRSAGRVDRSEEHTSELQSRLHLVCRLLLEKKTQSDATLH